MKRKRNVYWTLILCIIIAAVVFPFSVNKMQDTLLKSGQSMGLKVRPNTAPEKKCIRSSMNTY